MENLTLEQFLSAVERGKNRNRLVPIPNEAAAHKRIGDAVRRNLLPSFDEVMEVRSGKLGTRDHLNCNEK
jgi:hypothetical protein